jgi:protein-disulfide isomerase
VQFLEVSDFACPFCARFDATTWPRIRQEFVDTGLVRSLFLASPDPQKPFAEDAAALAVCMAANASFGDVRMALFTAPRPLDAEVLDDRVASMGLDGDLLNRCRTGPGLQQVRAQRRLAELLSVPGTPTFYIGRVDRTGDNMMRVVAAIAGLRPYEEFAAAFRAAQGS